MVSILITEPIYEGAVEELRKRFSVDVKLDIRYEELLQIIERYDAVIIRGRTKIDKEVLSKGSNLKLVVRVGVGLDNVDLDEAKVRGVMVRNTPAAPTRAVAELALMLILAVLRRAGYGYAKLRGGVWVKREIIGGELFGKTVGIIGFGRIGYTLSKLVKSLGARVVAYDVLDRSREAREIGVELKSSVEDLLRTSDIVSVHVPLLPSTYHYIDEEKLMMMKPGAILINTSRGAVVDTKALLKALKSGRLGGAGLDVLEHEPPSEDWEMELIKMPNVFVTPHIGAQTREAQVRGGMEAAGIVIDFFRDKG